MERADKNLAFLQQYENIAWYEDGRVKILDRRIYPIRTEYVVCSNYKEVAKAIKNMVTQSRGPNVAASMGMALAAFNARDKSEKDLFAHIEEARYALSHARPTTSAGMVETVNRCMEVAKEAYQAGEEIDQAIFKYTLNWLDDQYNLGYKIAQKLVDIFPDKCTIMTQCFDELVVGIMLNVSKERGKKVKVICPETRPYFQGARLTASVACDQGFDVTVITDNMPGYVLKERKVDLFTSGADVVCMDGHIVNKIGTFQIALAAFYWGIPFYVTDKPNKHHPTIDTVEIEERDPSFVLQAMGQQITMKGVKGYYPAFDITPPKLVTGGIVTDKGIYSPYDLHRYFQSE